MSDDRSLTNPTANVPDAGTAAPTIMPSGPVPVQTADTPNQITPGDNSNRPDASTPAANSIPVALVNNPAVPTQKMASQVDANKNSDSPPHSMLYRSALEMIGDPKITTVAPDGTVTRKSPEVKPWQLGLALALQVLAGGIKGGIAGGNAPDSISAAQAGMQVAAKQRAGVQAENDKQAEQAISDQDHKLKVTEANMRMHQNAMLAGAASEKVANTLGESTDFFTKGVIDGTIPMGDMTHEEVTESDAAASVANGNSNVTKDYHIAFGPAKPLLDKNGQQVILNGQPAWQHQYMIIHGAADGKMPLTKEMQDKFVKYGLMPAIPEGGIGAPAWPFASIAKNLSDVASIDTGEQILKEHKDDVTRLLDHAGTGGADGKGVQDLADITKQIQNDPDFRNALKMFAQAQAHTPGANHHIEDILNTMGAQGIEGAKNQGIIMNHLGLSSQDLDDMHNKRAEAEAEAKDTKTHTPLQPDTVGKAAAIYNDPGAPADKKAQAKGVLDFFDKQEQDKAQTAVNKAEAIADAKQNSKDRRTPVYVDTPDGLVYTDRYTAEHSMGAASNAIEEMKPSDLVKDKTAMRQLTDVQMNTSRYTQAIANDLPKVTEQDRDRMREIQALNSQNGGNLVSLGQGGLSLNIPVVSAKLTKANYKQLSDDLNSLSAPAKNVMNAYLRTAAAVPAYQKALTGIGRSNKEMLDLELANVPMPYFDAATASERMQAFQENIDRAGKGFPNNLPGMEHPSSVRKTMEASTSAPQFRRDPQTNKVQQSTDGGKSWK